MGSVDNRRSHVSALVAASVVGVYTLIMLGAGASVTDALAACQGWPTCNGRLVFHPSEPGAIAMAHRLFALIVGILLLATVAMAWLKGTSRRVRFLLTAALVLYPVQAFIGRLVALGWDGSIRSSLHLIVGVGIFSALVVSLAWMLEATHPGAIDRSSTREPSAPGEGHQPNPAGDPPRRTLAMAYFRLTKPKLMWLLCLVAAAGMALAAGPTLGVGTIVATLGGGVLAIGASGTFNHVLERDVDRRMSRTADRPLATDIVPIRHAILFGCILAASSIAILLVFVNVVAAALTIAAIVFYSVVYTIVLKPNTVQNTAIGGFAGALPALIGWAAVTGGIELPGLLLALVVFCWTPAHFYNLAMAYRDDYEAGGFPMLPVVRGDRVASKHVLYWAGATMISVAALAATATLGWLYAAAGVLGAGIFLAMIYLLHTQATQRAAFRTFHASNAYLGLLLFVIAVDALLA